MQTMKKWSNVEQEQWQAHGKSIKDVWDVKTYVTKACHF